MRGSLRFLPLLRRLHGWSMSGLLALFPLVAAAATGNALPWDDAGQLVLVITPDWDASDGSLQRFERIDGRWQAVAAAVPITVGRAGSAWGIGLHPLQSHGPQKREGDGRAPAGAFALGDAFGYAGSADTAMPYRAMRASDYCIDVDGSPLYNRIVDRDEVGEAAVAGSTEPMRRDLHADGDQRYRQGLVIRHNPDNLAGAGSCIFAHLWKAPGEATAGCTAMDAEAMQALLAWLQPQAQPVFVLLPQAEYARLKRSWQLPQSAGAQP
ncbi:L,D-peptidoglycan transpeptidase YkuD, ErfK/YbiS/YcfS/YnhG family [Pseudoxanthomonas wuyuanensis]|uniref:L,D-peptidoglycan transpeptidase YkuD, ErfK/YbiS/YcfS/YnhG family n=2 Tax=Pseudoxanthomonas wuyuanensis TaxID=1073196 RepID=A0A286D9U8_9GAMM|nr:L,D-peptidoglycan transpeptidase YkuD, ErfK/YbiS/YcfS/YnhG family [Pseudoxanthomonas wuyuanensis]